MKKIRSSQASISISSCANLNKTNRFKSDSMRIHLMKYKTRPKKKTKAIRSVISRKENKTLLINFLFLDLILNLGIACLKSS